MSELMYWLMAGCFIGGMIVATVIHTFSLKWERADNVRRLDYFNDERRSLQEELEEYTSKTWPVSYYCRSAGRQALEQYALALAGNWWWAPYSHKFEDIEEIKILKPATFSKTIALAIRDHGLKVKETATEIKVWQEVGTSRGMSVCLKKEIKEK